LEEKLKDAKAFNQKYRKQLLEKETELQASEFPICSRNPFFFTSLINDSACTVVNINVGSAIAQAVSHRPLTAVARVHARVNPVGFMVEKMALGQFFSEFFGFPLSISFHHVFNIH
jgi:hypothetical protein